MVRPLADHCIDPTQYIRNYLDPHAKQLLNQLRPLIQEAYHSCLCIPAYCETRPLEQIWGKTRATQRHLIIILGNAPIHASAQAKAETWASLKRLADNHDVIHSQVTPNHWPWTLVRASDHLDLLLIQARSPLPSKQGVGRARKIIMDLATGLFEYGHLNNPWIGNTDGDSELPEDYWQRLQMTENTVPGLRIFPFRHECLHDNDSQLLHAHRLYEFYLEQYRSSLAMVMPEYAHPTLGSLYVIHTQTYQQVRGYPCKAAGEDFYLLNKIVKIAPVTLLSGSPILLNARQSQRTPYGTGPSISRLLAQGNPDDVPFFYDPECLYHWQHALHKLRHDAPEQWQGVPERWRLKAIRQYAQCTTLQQKNSALLSIIDGLRCQQLLRIIHHRPMLSWRELNQRRYP